MYANMKEDVLMNRQTIETDNQILLSIVLHYDCGSYKYNNK